VNTKRSINDRTKRGTTLTEVVIALSVIAFSVPLILGATGGAHQSRQDAEADTRAIWIVGDVKRRVINKWSTDTQRSDVEETLIFPSSATPKNTIKMFYDKQGSLIEHDHEKGVYLVTVEASPYVRTHYYSDISPLARVIIKIQQPAKSSSDRQKKLTYQFVSNRYGF
jgi:hypothetical protein